MAFVEVTEIGFSDKNSSKAFSKNFFSIFADVGYFLTDTLLLK